MVVAAPLVVAVEAIVAGELVELGANGFAPNGEPADAAAPNGEPADVAPKGLKEGLVPNIAWPRAWHRIWEGAA